MTQIELDIQVLEGTINSLNEVISNLDATAAAVIIQQRDAMMQQLNAKKQQLQQQEQETIYEHLSRIVGYSDELKDCIEKTVDQLLVTDISNASDPGLLLGKIQCGKTRAFVV